MAQVINDHNRDNVNTTIATSTNAKTKINIKNRYNDKKNNPSKIKVN